MPRAAPNSAPVSEIPAAARGLVVGAWGFVFAGATAGKMLSVDDQEHPEVLLGNHFEGGAGVGCWESSGRAGTQGRRVTAQTPFRWA